MNRRHLTFSCEDETLVGTIDDVPGKVGLLIVSGGNETRAGAFSGQAQLATEISSHGFPVLRFDRRGVGDSSGENSGFKGSGPDIAAASRAFRDAVPSVNRIVMLGNCDAATALSFDEFGDARILSNPWVYGDEYAGDTAPPAEAIRSRYAAKLANPKEIWRLLSGKVSFRKLASGIWASIRPKNENYCDEALAMATRLSAHQSPARILIAGNDRTAQYFTANWNKDDERLAICPSADHAFSGKEAQRWYVDNILAVLHEQAGQLNMS